MYEVLALLRIGMKHSILSIFDRFYRQLWDYHDHSKNFAVGHDLDLTDGHCDNTSSLRNLITDFLSKCDLNYPKGTVDLDFVKLCTIQAAQKGYIVELCRWIPPSAIMARQAYAHLDESTQVFITLYTSFLIYTDDVFQEDVEAIRDFNERFVKQRPQKLKILDNLATHLLEIPSHYSVIVSNLITTSTLNLVTALLLEHETRDLTIHSGAESYPAFVRAMSGASDAYALFAFPPNVPIRDYIQTIPDISIFIDNVNDLLSFYKEEMAGDTGNRVSLLAKSRKVSKMAALSIIAEEAVQANQRVVQTLGTSCTLRYFRQFSQGYIGFHTISARYRLDELNI